MKIFWKLEYISLIMHAIHAVLSLVVLYHSTSELLHRHQTIIGPDLNLTTFVAFVRLVTVLYNHMTQP